MHMRFELKSCRHPFKQNTYFIQAALIPGDVAPATENVVYLLDVSGSMAGERIDLARPTLISSIEELPARALYSLITFNHEAQLIISPTEAGSNFRVNKQAIESLQAAGGTSITAAFDKMREHLPKSNDSMTVLLMSDGEDSEAKPKRILEQLTAQYGKNLTVVAIGLGNSYSDKLKEFCTMSGIPVIHIADGEDMKVNLQVAQSFIGPKFTHVKLTSMINGTSHENHLGVIPCGNDRYGEIFEIEIPDAGTHITVSNQCDFFYAGKEHKFKANEKRHPLSAELNEELIALFVLQNISAILRQNGFTILDIIRLQKLSDLLPPEDKKESDVIKAARAAVGCALQGFYTGNKNAAKTAEYISGMTGHSASLATNTLTGTNGTTQEMYGSYKGEVARFDMKTRTLTLVEKGEPIVFKEYERKMDFSNRENWKMIFLDGIFSGDEATLVAQPEFDTYRSYGFLLKDAGDIFDSKLTSNKRIANLCFQIKKRYGTKKCDISEVKFYDGDVMLVELSTNLKIPVTTLSTIKNAKCCEERHLALIALQGIIWIMNDASFSDTDTAPLPQGPLHLLRDVDDDDQPHYFITYESKNSLLLIDLNQDEQLVFDLHNHEDLRKIAEIYKDKKRGGALKEVCKKKSIHLPEELARALPDADGKSTLPASAIYGNPYFEGSYKLFTYAEPAGRFDIPTCLKRSSLSFNASEEPESSTPSASAAKSAYRRSRALIKQHAASLTDEEPEEKEEKESEGRNNEPDEENDKDGIPYRFLCAITFDVMTDPVATADGHIYERSAIASWLETNDTSPNTNEILPNKILTPQDGLRKEIENWHVLENYRRLVATTIQLKDREFAEDTRPLSTIEQPMIVPPLSSQRRRHGFSSFSEESTASASAIHVSSSYYLPSRRQQRTRTSMEPEASSESSEQRSWFATSSALMGGSKTPTPDSRDKGKEKDQDQDSCLMM